MNTKLSVKVTQDIQIKRRCVPLMLHKISSIFLLLFLVMLTSIKCIGVEKAKESEGQYVPILAIGGVNEGVLVMPIGIVVDNQDNVFVVDSFLNSVQKFDSQGDLSRTIASPGIKGARFWLPQDIAIDSKNNIYVADAGNSRIQKFSSQGSRITALGQGGREEGRLLHPRIVTLDKEGNIYVGELSGRWCRFQKFDSMGNFLMSFGSYGTGRGQFQNPKDMTVAQDGSIYVVDSKACRVQKFNPKGELLLAFGEKGRELGQFNKPFGIALDSKGNVYVTDENNDNIQKFSPEGKFLEEFALRLKGKSLQLQSIFIDNKGFLYVADRATGRLRKYEWKGNLLKEYGNDLSPSSLISPCSLTVHQDSLYIGDYYGANIKEFDLKGNFKRTFAEDIANLRTIASDRDGSLYILTRNVFWKFDKKGEITKKFRKDLIGNDFTLDRKGNIYVLDTREDVVKTFDPLGNLLKQFPIENVHVEAIAVDREGRIYIAGDKIHIYDEDGKFIKRLETYCNENLRGKGGFKLGSSWATDITIDRKGSIYIGDHANVKIKKLDAQGNLTTEFGASNEQWEPGDKLAGIAFDKEENAYLAYFTKHKVIRFSKKFKERFDGQ